MIFSSSNHLPSTFARPSHHDIPSPFPSKDDDTLSVYKIQSSHTIHMVKGAVRATNASNSSSTTAGGVAPQQLPTMQAGQNVHDPLTQLNSHLGYGAMAGLNPFADMGLNPSDPNMVRVDFVPFV